MSRSLSGQAAFCVLLIAAARLQAQSQPAPADDSASTDSDRAKRLQEVTAATAFELWAGRYSDQKVKLIERPVLRWSNPVRATSDGAVSLWTAHDRPAAALCMYTAGDEFAYEWQSLSTGALRATYRQRTVWQPPDASLEFRPLSGGAEPAAATPARRLSQMHRLLRDFTASFGQEPQRHELCALTQPIYRYGGGETGVVDGAVFAFAQATDPELLLLLEARAESGQPPTWRWAAARMSMTHLDLKYRGELIWTIDRWNQWREARQPYLTFGRRWMEGR